MLTTLFFLFFAALFLTIVFARAFYGLSKIKAGVLVVFAAGFSLALAHHLTKPQSRIVCIQESKIKSVDFCSTHRGRGGYSMSCELTFEDGNQRRMFVDRPEGFRVGDQYCSATEVRNDLPPRVTEF